MSGKYTIKTFGCQMNKSDSERLKTLLESMHLKQTNDDTKADVILYNTCSVRQTAEDRIYGQKKHIARLKKKNPKLIAGITGCMPGRDMDGKIRNRLPEFDLFFPVSEMIRLPQKIAELNPNLTQNTKTKEYQDYLQINPLYEKKYAAFVPISTGCNKKCAYCVVPDARGIQKDRPFKEIIKEVTGLVNSECKEITLLGQTVNWYNPIDKDQFSKENKLNINPNNYFGALIWELNQIPGLKRLHYTAAHPNHITPEVIVGLALPSHLNYLHLPVQSGNNKILEKMKRPYTREDFLKKIKQIQKIRPNIALGTDIIVGFCGETEKQFEDTVSMFKECQFDISYTAMYSVRSGTHAASNYKDEVPLPEKKKRWRTLQNLMEQIVLEKNQAYVNNKVEVLVDTVNNGICEGNSREMKRVQFRGDPSMLGNIHSIHVQRAVEWMLYGTINQ